MTVLLERFVVALERIASALEGTRPTEHTATVEPVVELDMEAVKAEMAAAIGKPSSSRSSEYQPVENGESS